MEILEIGGLNGSEIVVLVSALGEVQSAKSAAHSLPVSFVSFSFRSSFDAHWPFETSLRPFLMAEPLQIRLLKSNRQVAEFQLRPFSWLRQTRSCGAHHGTICLQKGNDNNENGNDIWIRLQVDAGLAEDPNWFGSVQTEGPVKVPEKGEIIRIPDGPDNEDQTDQTVRFDSECDSLRSLLRQAFFDGKQPADMAREE